MAGGPEDHFTDSCELYVLVEGDEWHMWRPLIPTPVTGPAGLRNSDAWNAHERSHTPKGPLDPVVISGHRVTVSGISIAEAWLPVTTSGRCSSC
jgi:hypothetical protein